MAVRSDQREAIAAALNAFATQPIAEAGRQLFATLGYHSDRRIPIATPQEFREQLDPQGKLTEREGDALEKVNSLHLLFQLTNAELDFHGDIFDEPQAVQKTKIESYLLFAAELAPVEYTRTALSTLVRAVNKPLPMPALILFRYGDSVSLGIIHRRLHKREESKDVLEKVTLIKDIQFANPHRAHVEILYDLSLETLHEKPGFTNFVELHNAWQKTLDSSELNKRFYQEIANWYFWACDEAGFPKAAGKDKKTRNAVSLIRLITRLIFVWFVKEKGLVPEDLFDKRKVAKLLKPSDPEAGAYYKAILQNLFFASLNTEMNTPQNPDNRKFRATRARGRDQHYMVHNLYRYREAFQNPDQALKLFSTIPFLNGGLFECLDTFDEKDPAKVIRIDGFSDRPDNELHVPDYLFFSEEREVDLNEVYGTKNKRYKVRGLIDTFNRYKFTINENTPIERKSPLIPSC